jgi:hypothetical protein
VRKNDIQKIIIPKKKRKKGITQRQPCSAQFTCRTIATLPEID